jgi:uncharacterized protein YjbI with pentapeptide repeats
MITYPCRRDSTQFIGPRLCNLGHFNFEDFEDLPDPAASQQKINEEQKKISAACSVSGRVHTDGHYYCWLHLPSKAKAEDPGFRRALRDRVVSKDDALNFRGVYFPSLFGNEDFFGPHAADNTFAKKVYFAYATFCEGVDFAHATFTKTASFAKATFHGPAYFHKATFLDSTKFQKSQFLERADFSNCVFEKNAEFHMAYFGDDAVYREAVFGKISAPGPFDFQKVLFQKEAVFEGSAFFTKTRSSFLDAKFKDYANFKRIDFPSSNPPALDTPSTPNTNGKIKKFPEDAITFEDAEFDSTARFSAKDPARDWYDRRIRFMQAYFKDPRKVAFRKVKLNPSSFVRTSLREIEFTDVEWLNTQGGSLKSNFEAEARLYFGPEVFGTKDRISGAARHMFNRFLLTACRRLALNSEEDTRYRDASNFRRMAFELERFGHKVQFVGWVKGLAGFFQRDSDHPPLGTDPVGYVGRLGGHLGAIRYDFVHLLYNILSGYGERGAQAFIWLVIIWIGCAAFYGNYGAFVDGDGVEKAGMLTSQALTYSLQVLTLQKPDLKPNNTATIAFYAVETIWAPIQLALFALAIRRKFMR